MVGVKQKAAEGYWESEKLFLLQVKFYDHGFKDHLIQIPFEFESFF